MNSDKDSQDLSLGAKEQNPVKDQGAAADERVLAYEEEGLLGDEPDSPDDAAQSPQVGPDKGANPVPKARDNPSSPATKWEQTTTVFKDHSKLILAVTACMLVLVYKAKGLFFEDTFKAAPVPQESSWPKWPKMDLSDSLHGAVTIGNTVQLLRKHAPKVYAAQAVSPTEPAVQTQVLVKPQSYVAQQKTPPQRDKAALKPQKPKKRTRRRVKKAASPKKPVKKELPYRRFFAPGISIDMSPPVEKKKAHHFDLTTRIPVVLEVGITSVRHSIVLARLTADITTRQGTLIPKGAIVTGKSSSGVKRIFCEFKEIISGDQKIPLTGVAITGSNLGILARVHKSSLEERAEARVAQGAIDTLKGVAVVAADRLSHGVLRGTDRVFDEAKEEYQPDRAEWLEVPAGTPFEIVITATGD